jgi:molecular chaperone DnaJ
MSDKRDFYEVLGVAKNAQEADIKKAYRKMAMQYHPDRNPGDKAAEQKFKDVQEAYDILADPQKRAAYDQYGHAAFQMGGSPGGFGGFNGSFDIGDIMEEFFGGGSPFESIFGGSGGNRKSRPRRGSDIQYQMELTFEQAVFGHKTEISIPRTEECNTCGGRGGIERGDVETCPVCQGKGQVQRTQGIFSIATPCHNCNGTGRVIKKPCYNCHGKGVKKRTSKLSVSIPAGVDDGVRIKLKREGESGENGGPPGDLYILIRVQEHEFFRRDGNDIILKQKIGFAQAVLGCSIKVPTLREKVKLTIPAGTPGGRVFRIRGAGVESPHGYGKGDQLVEIEIDVPKDLNADQKKLLRDFARSRGEEVEEPGFMDKAAEKVKEFFN